jgi:TPR repeat protein
MSAALYYGNASSKPRPRVLPFSLPALVGAAVLYHNTQGVAQDHTKAREWYEKAAAKGDASAMFNLGVLYDNGFGVALLGVKRTWPIALHMSAFDPYQT